MNCATNISPDIRRKLLSTASALALLGAPCAARAANADADKPSFWIELGGQMENVSGQGEIFNPPFLGADSGSPVLGNVSPLQAQRPPTFSFGEEGKISFQPEGSEWSFSAALRFGRSSGFRKVDHQTNGKHYRKYLSGHPKYNSNNLPTTAEAFAKTQARHRESHAILDFAAGKDVGFGLLGSGGSSNLNLGVRFAQFESTASVDMKVRPYVHFLYGKITPNFAVNLPYFYNYYATGHARREFRGVGPSLSWNASAALAGNAQDGELGLDWGVNAALLFGRYKSQVEHHESTRYFHKAKYLSTVSNPAPVLRSHERSVTVPNIGGFAGVSYRVTSAKISLGYRADFFFGAVDTGIDAARNATLGFKGPYASISVGLGN